MSLKDILIDESKLINHGLLLPEEMYACILLKMHGKLRVG